ncbi:pentapeptide repeat-containing protein [bacterium]|nr:pentapeptide repeat-containing protein [bacterium]
MSVKVKGKKVLSPEEVKRQIFEEGRSDFEEVIIIEGSLDLNGLIFDYPELNLTNVTIQGSLGFNEATIKGNLWLIGATINGDLDLGRGIVNGVLNLDNATIRGNLYLPEATLKDVLSLEGTIIEGDLDLSTDKGPTRIYVDYRNAELVHFAAPTVSLIVKRRQRE